MYYSTGKSPYLKYRGFAVDCSAAAAEKLIEQGFLVRSLEDLSPKSSEVAEELPEVAKPVIIINEATLGRCKPVKDEDSPKPVKSINVSDMIAKSKKNKKK